MTWFFLTIVAALCWGIAQVLIKKGFDHLSPLWNNIINNALTSFIYPVFMVILAIKFLKERITIRQSAEIATIVCGLLLVGFSSGA